MMIQAKLWSRFCTVGGVVAIPAAFFDCFDPGGSFGHALQVVSLSFLIALGALGALTAILLRAGVIQFRYTEDDKRRWLYRMSKFIAEKEYSNGRPFSSRYFETYGLGRGKTGSDDKRTD
jgi:hypothetical protein